MNKIKTKEKSSIFIVLMIALVCIMVATHSQSVHAATYKLSATSVTLTKGSTKKLYLKNAPAGAKITWSTSNQYAVSVSEDGQVKAEAYGRATITATYKKKSYSANVIVPDTSKNIVPNTYTVELTEGKTYKLTATSVKKVTYMSRNEHIATVSEDGLITAMNPGTTQIILKSTRSYAECTVTVTADSVNASMPSNIVSKKKTAIRRLSASNNIIYKRITWVQNKDIRFKIANVDENEVKKCVWYTSDENILSNPQKGDSKIVASAKTISKGNAKVSAVVTYKSGKVKTYTTKVYVTKPKISTKNIIALGANAGSNRQQYISFSGLSRYSKVTWTVSDSKKIKLISYQNEASVMGLSSGTGTIKAVVDGKTYKIAYTVCNPVFNSIDTLVAKGKTTQINITGLSGVTPVYTSRNTSIATVDQTGKITGKKGGNTYVDVNLGAYNFSYRVEIAATGIKTIVKRAKYIVNNWVYSQTNRMDDGYYDCSALVWKGYKAYNNYQEKLGSKTVALPAASIFDYLCSKKQIIYYGYIGWGNLRAGDLIFYGDYNSAVKYSTPGRTLNIYHVAMYAGNGYVVEKGGQPITYNNLNHVVGIGRVVN
jgi:hypothetical protein